MNVEVLKIFNTSIGLILVLRFPPRIRPAVGMNFSNDNNKFTIKALSFEHPKIEVDSENSYACVVSLKNKNINTGHIFTSQYSASM